MLRIIETYFILFMIYSFLGWLMEVIGKFFQFHRFINRGFLIGPYCPIYGWGAVAITIILKKYLDDPITLFIMTLLTCSILEYFTSYFMEKIFHARWWDYSQRKFNINGRICLNTMIPFGILGMLISYVFNPFFLSGIDSLDNTVLTIISAIIFVLFLVDNIISTNILSKVKHENNILDKDNTEEMARKVKEALKARSWTYRRLLNAYPNAKHITKVIKEKLEKATDSAKESIQRASENYEKAKAEFKENVDKTKNELKEKIDNVRKSKESNNK